MDKKYKALLAADMDFTLLAPGKDIPEGNKEAIRALKESSVAFTIATGRSSFLVGRFAEDLGIDVPLITSNGGSLFDASARKQFESKDFEDAKIRTLLGFLIDKSADATLYSDEGIFFAPDSTRHYFVEAYNSGVEPSKRSPMVEIDKSFLELEKIPKFNKILLQSADEDVIRILSSDPDLEVISSGPNLFDVMRSGVSKGGALLSLAGYLGIPSQNTFAIGDSDNDISMIESAEYGIAVGNATEGVKAVAAYITANYDSLGFAKAVYEYIIPLVQKF
jgi:Cof subfamily protein (haloacid dehalogenase superfamily)